MDGWMDGLDRWIGWSRSKGQAWTLALAMPPPAASAPAYVGAWTPGTATASVSAATPGTATATVSASTPGTANASVSASTPGLNQCPDAWARRHRKRAEAIAAVKRSREYQDFCSSSQEFQGYCRLMLRLDEPDPSDRSVSKRAWEKAVQCWRSDLRFAVGC